VSRTQAKIQTANFTRGFITEASPLTFPENSCLDILNMEINLDGSVSRRKGAELEENYQTHAYTAGAIDYFSTFSWRNAAGRSDVNFIVVKAGRYLIFYEDTTPLSANKHSQVIDLNTYKVTAASTTDIINNRVDFAHGKGYLFVTSKYIDPLRISYDPTADTFSVTTVDIFDRDFDGVDDGLDVTTRPLTLSSEHLYNLLNQGWDNSKINQYHKATDVYPSNADIWSAGRDGSNNFSPSEMNKLNFGNSPAPKGSFIRSIFDTTQSFSNDSNVAISSWSVTCGTPDVVTITTAANHGLSASDSVTISGTSYNWNDGDDSGSGTVDGTFTVSTVVNTTTFTYTTTVANCAHITSKNNSGTATVGTVTNPSGTVEDWRPNTVAFFAGRAFFAGVESSNIGDNVYFSQILTDIDRIKKAYQDADPTSDEISDIIDTDGGKITIAGLGRTVKIIPVQRSVLVFSTNGIWEISGPGDGFFTATDYSVRKVGSVSCNSPDSIIEVEGVVFLFAEDGIYIIRENEISGLLSPANISDQTIRSFYLEIPSISKERVFGVYDDQVKKIAWGFRRFDGVAFSPDVEVLIFDLRTESFAKYKFKIESHYPAAMAVIKDYSPDSNKIRILTVISGASLSFSELKNTKFEDWGTDNDAYVLSGWETLGDLGVKKQARNIILHFLRTETGFTEDGSGNLHPISPSGCKVRATWEWTNDIESNKWSPEFQGYRYRQLYTASGPSDTFNTGYEVITTKTKLRGNGRSLSVQFRSEPGKDLKLLGWTIDMNAEDVQ
jgi:hypothetical protein